jgi:hypothetical protein
MYPLKVLGFEVKNIGEYLLFLIALITIKCGCLNIGKYWRS